MSDALREAAVYAPIDRAVLLTYELTHSAFASRALVVADYQDLVAKDENGVTVTYKALAGIRPQGFEESDQASSPTIKLTLDGVSAVIIADLDAALQSLEPVGLVERIYASDDLTTPAILPLAKVILKSASITETKVTVEAGFGDSANQPFPRKNYTRDEYPSLATQ